MNKETFYCIKTGYELTWDLETDEITYPDGTIFNKENCCYCMAELTRECTYLEEQ